MSFYDITSSEEEESGGYAEGDGEPVEMEPAEATEGEGGVLTEEE